MADGCNAESPTTRKSYYMDEVATSEIQEITPPEQIEENVEAVEVSEQEPVKNVEEDPQEKNWKKARQIMEQQKYEIDLLKQKLDQINKPADPEPEEDLTDDDIVRGHHLKKKLQMMEKALLKNEALTAVDRARSKFNDFDDVVSVENVEFLKQNDPELAYSLQSLAHDPYAQAMATYKVLKRSDYTQQKQSMEDKQRLEKNVKKPASINSVGKQSAIAEANRFSNGLTPELKKALLKEMQEASRRS